MRRWVFLLLIVLLPLRGWIGDAMAMQMALPGQHAPASSAMPHGEDTGATHARAFASAGADNCDEHAGTQSAGQAVDDAHCDACTLCQTCHTVAVLQSPDLLTALQLSPLSPAATMHGFASADRALFLKPPIL